MSVYKLLDSGRGILWIYAVICILILLGRTGEALSTVDMEERRSHLAYIRLVSLLSICVILLLRVLSDILTLKSWRHVQSPPAVVGAAAQRGQRTCPDWQELV